MSAIYLEQNFQALKARQEEKLTKTSRQLPFENELQLCLSIAGSKPEKTSPVV